MLASTHHPNEECLIEAIKNNDYNLVKSLLTGELDLDTLRGKPLAVAATYRKYEIGELILQSGITRDIDTGDAVINASKNGDVKFLRLLRNYGVKLYLTSNAPIYAALSGNHLEALELLSAYYYSDRMRKDRYGDFRLPGDNLQCHRKEEIIHFVKRFNNNTEKVRKQMSMKYFGSENSY